MECLLNYLEEQKDVYLEEYQWHLLNAGDQLLEVHY